MDKERCLLYESGELSPEEAAEFERHLPGCPDCRAWLSVVRRVDGWAEALALEPAEERVPGPEPADPPAVRKLPLWAPLTFAVGFACLAVVLLSQRRAPEPSRGSFAHRPLPSWNSGPLHIEVLRTRERLAVLEKDVQRATEWSAGGRS